ncbi:hypothetical protein NRK67_14065 [Fusobacteria bacterium ZRK30]|nr:hypothetical protein NRK67_14065 [Fusobacteria bacterium ZRK30]
MPRKPVTSSSLKSVGHWITDEYWKLNLLILSYISKLMILIFYLYQVLWTQKG